MKGPGYDAANPITPYIHVMVYHCPSLLHRYGNIKMFTGQGNIVVLMHKVILEKIEISLNGTCSGRKEHPNPNFPCLYIPACRC